LSACRTARYLEWLRNVRHRRRTPDLGRTDRAPEQRPTAARETVIRIADIETGSIADELQLEIGSRIIRINGHVVRDGIDLTYLLADSELELETVSPAGETVVYEVSRDGSDPMGIVPAPDKVRECANECVFCFIDGNPEHVRESLWLRDDDFRLSFTYGSYVTLTNLGPRGIQRLVDQRISPLYVSVHATEPDVRTRLLKNDRSGLIMEHLRFFARHGLEVHTQVVLCPGWNDGVHLDRTVDDLWSIGPEVRSLSVVPVGLTKYNLDRPVRLLTAEEAGTAIEQVERARRRALEERGTGWAYAADEMWLIARQAVPTPDYYDDWALLENGVGALRRFLLDFDEGLEGVPPLHGRRLRLVTGASMAPIFRERAPRLAAATGAEVEVVEVENRLFGPTVTTAGLLPGEDIVRAIDEAGPSRTDDVVLLPAEALNGDDRFIDSVALDEVRRRLAPARVVTGFEITRTLRELPRVAA
jgi:putative radical SAM enzyme (TIGR03279 family)